MNAEAAELLRRFAVEIDVRRPLMDFSTAIQQMVAIARAVSFKARLVIMDEPTSSLDEREVAVLVRRHAATAGRRRRGDLHHPSARRALSGLRPGHGHARRAHGDDEPHGRRRQAPSHRGDARARSRNRARPRDRLFRRLGEGGRRSASMPRGCEIGRRVRDARVEVKAGQIVGLAGLLGSGRTETARAIFGADPPDAGTIRLLGKAVSPREPSDAIALGVGYCSEDRKADGIVPDMSVRENITLAILPRLVRMGVVDEARQRAVVDKFMKRLADQGLERRAEDPRAVGRQPAEGSARPLALHRSEAADPRRADPRHRRRRQGRDPVADPRARRPGPRRPDDFLRTRRNHRRRGPRVRAERRTHRRRPAARAASASAIMAAMAHEDAGAAGRAEHG